MADSEVFLRPEVHASIKSRNAWPYTEKFQDWLRDRRKSISNNVLPRLRKMGAAPLPIIEQLIEYQLHSPPSNEKEAKRANAFLVVLADLGLAEPQLLSPVDIAKMLVDISVDHLATGTSSIIAAIQAGLDMSPVTPQATDVEIKTLILWMYVDLGRRVRPSTPMLSQEKAINTAESLIGIPLAEYQARAVSWKNSHPWAIAPTRVGNSLVGAPIILPLKYDVYEQARSGERFVSEVGPEELEVPSRNLFVEGISERSSYLSNDSEQFSLHLRASIAQQLGHFCPSYSPADQPIRLLSRAASPLSSKRLEGCQFRPVGTFECKTGIPLHELEIDPTSTSGDHLIITSILEKLGRIEDVQGSKDQE